MNRELQLPLQSIENVQAYVQQQQKGMRLMGVQKEAKRESCWMQPSHASNIESSSRMTGVD